MDPLGEEPRRNPLEIKKAFSFDDEEESDWNSSKIKGFTFNDDEEETPYQDLEQYRSSSIISNVTSSSASKGGRDNFGGEEFVISFDLSQSGPVSDRVKHAAACSRFQSNLSSSNVFESNPIPTDPKKLENEVRYLRRQAEKLKYARYVPLHPKDTIKDILLDREYSLEFYKTYELKKELLDAAISVGDGNAILAVTLFLRNTLNERKFIEVLLTRPVAMNHLAVYLDARNSHKELSEIHSALGNYEDSSFAEYKKILTESSGIEHQIKKLKFFLQNAFRPHQDYIIEHINLMDRIIAINSTVKLPESTSGDHGLFRSVLACNTVLYALRFLYYHFPKESENLLHSPAGLHKTHKLSDKQNAWNGIYASASKGSWASVRAFATTKSWLGGLKPNASVNFERLVKILNEQFSAPLEELIFYLNYVEPIEDRLTVAHKIKATTVVIDCYVSMRDRASLVKYAESLIPKSSEWLYAENALNAGSTKWKN